MNEVGRFPHAVVCFCATCNRYWGWGKNECLGTDFTCPDQPTSEKHIARVLLNEAPAFCWLRIEWFLYCWQTRLSPHAFLHKWYSWWEAGYYVTLWFLLIFLALLCESQYAPVPRAWSRPVFIIVLAARLIDVILTNVSITITSKFPANRLRSVALTLAGYLQIILTYAYFYAVGGQAWFPSYQAVRHAVYFSFGTAVTVGYGNLEPTQLVPLAAVVSELLLGLFFIVIIVAQVVAWTAQPKVSPGEFSLEHVSLHP